MIITRSAKGQALTHEELDNNFVELRDRPEGQTYPSWPGVGLKLDHADPDFGWRDIVGPARNELSVSPPMPAVYQGSIRQFQMQVGDDAVFEYHLPHDYVPGTDIHIHAHWSHNSADVTGGGVTFQFELMYAKGHNQAFFATPILVSATQAASQVRYQHMLAEAQASAPGGVGGLLDTDQLEADGIIIARVVLNANTMTGAALPFLHLADIHYQSSNLATKNREPDFYG